MALFHYISRPIDTPTSVFDMGQLQRLRLTAGSNPNGLDTSRAREHQIAQQFEALFIQHMLKQARQVSQLEGLFDSDQTRLVQSMADEQTALHLANPGLGLAQALLEQIRGPQSEAPDNPADGSGRNNVPSPEQIRAGLPGQSIHEGEMVRGTDSLPGFLDRMSERLSASAVGRGVATVVSAIRGAPRHVESFVSTMSPAARQAATESGIPVELILSQAALESGWGQREIRASDGQSSYNLFGIKASSNWKGRVVDVMTTEYENGSARKRVQSFRAYGSYTESFRDYARLISSNERYRKVLEAPNPYDAARQIQRAGYATDPAYAEKLIAIMGYFRAGPA